MPVNEMIRIDMNPLSNGGRRRQAEDDAAAEQKDDSRKQPFVNRPPPVGNNIAAAARKRQLHVCFSYLPQNAAIANTAEIIPISQNLNTTLVSAHPNCSK